MRVLAGKIVFLSCLFVGAVAFVSAQGPAPQPGQGGAPAAGPARGGGGAMTNLKVLPKTWTRQQVGALMQTFEASLGVTTCAYCHAENPSAPPSARGPQLDYASDANPKKDIARTMIAMNMAINDNHLKAVGDAAVPEKVTCFTCHQGKEKPAIAPADGWGRGSFTLQPAGPVLPARGAGAPGGAPPAGGAPAGGAPPARGN